MTLPSCARDPRAATPEHKRRQSLPRRPRQRQDRIRPACASRRRTGAITCAIRAVGLITSTISITDQLVRAAFVATDVAAIHVASLLVASMCALLLPLPLLLPSLLLLTVLLLSSCAPQGHFFAARCATVILMASCYRTPVHRALFPPRRALLASRQHAVCAHEPHVCEYEQHKPSLVAPQALHAPMKGCARRGRANGGR